MRPPDEAALRDRALDRVRRLVRLESPSHDEAGLRTAAAEFASELTAVGAEVETRDVPGLGEHVIGRVPGSDPEAPPVLVLGHLDTVHPVGTFDPLFRVEEGRAYGPGIYDMKAGWGCLLEALAGLEAGGKRPRRPVVVLATCDEETGSDSSRELVEELAGRAHAVLVLEPAFADGAAKTSRKGVGWYRVEVEGRASHAGLAPEDGVNAVVELAHQVRQLTLLGDPGADTTVTPTRFEGGTAPNVVPARACVHVDVRFATPGEGERVDTAIRSLRPVVDGAAVRVIGGINRPPMERTPGVGSLYEQARRAAAEQGWELGERGSGGASDGSFAAGLGVPTLDGLGPAGGGAHSADEHIQLADLPRRVRLYARLLETL